MVERDFAPDIETAARMIGAGEVLVNDTIADKVGEQFPVDVSIRVKQKCIYVSRGGLKLEKGLKSFSIDPAGLCCIDVGASSGGFTDCLLQNGAARVYAIDVAYGQLDWKIRQDPRVVVKERFNARKITPDTFADSIDLAVMDVSFISLTSIIPVLLPLFKDTVSILALIKPQFELPKEKITKGGVVKDPALHKEAIDKITAFGNAAGLKATGVVESPIKGPKGNTEFLIHFAS